MNNADEIVRLTEKRNGENVIPMRNSVCGVGMPKWELYRKGYNETFLSGDAADRLAAYENTGLTPRQITVLQEMASKDADERVRLGNLIESLCADLVCVTEERDAAVADLHGTGACFTCKHFRRNAGDCFGAGRCRLDGIEVWPCDEPGVFRAEIPDDGRKTYEWRGMQPSGEGEADETL